ncbi:hypothetical protein D3C81_1372810 [compost metagenome]
MLLSFPPNFPILILFAYKFPFLILTIDSCFIFNVLAIDVFPLKLTVIGSGLPSAPPLASGSVTFTYIPPLYLLYTSSSEVVWIPFTNISPLTVRFEFIYILPSAAIAFSSKGLFATLVYVILGICNL